MTVICAVMRPYKLASMNFMAIFNEVMITVIMAYSGVFLQKDMNNDLAVDLGWIWIALASFTIVFNWVVWIGIQIWSKFKRTVGFRGTSLHKDCSLGLR